MRPLSLEDWAVNGMSYHDRAGENANSAIIVSVTPEDFSHDNDEKNPLSGIYFQRELEEKAYQAAGGNIPVQLYGDFISDCTSDHFGKVRPAFRGQYGFANLRRILPEALSASFIEAMEGFGHMIKGFDCPDAILAGIESRTSSPVRIPRDETLESAVLRPFSMWGRGRLCRGDHLRGHGWHQGSGRADPQIPAS